MKTLKTLLTGLLAIGLVGVAQAQTPIRITGSTAFRGNAYSAIQNIMDPGYTYGYTGTQGLPKAQAAIFKGTTTINGTPTPVTIYTSWSGSEAGNQTVSAGNIPVNFLPFNSTTSTGGTANLPPPTDPKIPDVGFSDTFQSSSVFFGNYRGTNYPPLNSSNTTPGLPSGQIVGVVQFKWVASKGAPASMTNMTSQLARNIFSTGFASLALFTGSNANESTSVIATGRDPDSGTRLTAFAESGLGAKASTFQFQPQDANGNVITTSGGTIAQYAPWPPETINGVPIAEGNGGYSSGGTLAAALNNTTPAGTILVTYAGTGDADSQITGNNNTGIVELSYNGVKLGIPENASLISEGAYTFWGYEHVYYRDATAGVVKNTADKLALQVYNVDAPAPHYIAMRVSRSTDGGTVQQTY